MKVRSCFIVLLIIFGLGLTALADNVEKVGTELTVNRAIEIALQKNLILKNLELELAQARIKLEGYQDKFYPRVILQGEAGVISEPDGEKLYSLVEIKPNVSWLIDSENSLTIGLGGVGWDDRPINFPKSNVISFKRTLLGGDQSHQAGIDSYQLMLLTRKISLEDNIGSISYQVIKGYYDVIKSIKLVELQKKSLNRAEEHYHEVKILFDAGQVAKLDCLNAQIQLAQEKSALQSAQDALLVQKMQFNHLLGVDLASEFIFSAELKLKDLQFSVDEAINMALGRSTQIKLYKEQLKVKKEEYVRTENSHLPDVDLVANYQWTDLDLGDGTTSIKIEVSYDPQIQRETKFTLEDNLLEQAKIEGQIRDTERKLIVEIKAKYANLAAYANDLAVEKEIIEKINNNLEIAKVRYQTGLTNGNEILDLQISLLRAEKNYYDTMINYNLAITELLRLVSESDL